MGENASGLEHLVKALTCVKSIEGLFISIDIENNRVSICGNTREILGITDEFLLLNLDEWIEMIDDSFHKPFFDYIRNSSERNKAEDFSIINILGERKWLSIQGYSKFDKSIFKGFEGYIKNNTSVKEQNLNENEDFIDKITGLHNRIYLEDKINNYLFSNQQTRCAFLILDLDNFKYINDTFGSDNGDIFLKEISKELEKLVLEKDFISRIGGDEFLIFLPDINSLNEVEDNVRNIIDYLNKSFKINDDQIYVTLSIGISIYPNDGTDFKQLLKNADAAMYMAKCNGKNQYQFFNSNISKELDKIYAIQRGLITALQNNEMYVVFQPKVTLNENKVTGFEALIRWHNPKLGMVRPDEFIPIAESTGLIIPIGKFVLREVFFRIKLLLQYGYDDFNIAINLSEIQLRDGDIIHEFKRLTELYDISGKYIEFEITESMLVKSFDTNRRYLMMLKEMGASIALDDFGTGYSSLNYLTKLPIDVLKIDRSFIIDILKNHRNKWIVENIIELSHKLGIEVVAEGVEEKEQVMVLKEACCDTVQGYYYSKPESFENIMVFLEK